MKKTYISPQCEVCPMDGAADLLVASNPATEMENPSFDIVQGGSGIWDDPDTEDDNWGN